MSNLEEQIADITLRNQRVEADKAWETSKVRIGTIAAIVYVVAVTLMWSLGVEQVWLNASIPALGFILSTISLPPLKQWWLHRVYKIK